MVSKFKAFLLASAFALPLAGTAALAQTAQPSTVGAGGQSSASSPAIAPSVTMPSTPAAPQAGVSTKSDTKADAKVEHKGDAAKVDNKASSSTATAAPPAEKKAMHDQQVRGERHKAAGGEHKGDLKNGEKAGAVDAKKDQTAAAAPSANGAAKPNGTVAPAPNATGGNSAEPAAKKL